MGLRCWLKGHAWSLIVFRSAPETVLHVMCSRCRIVRPATQGETDAYAKFQSEIARGVKAALDERINNKTAPTPKSEG